MKKLLFGALAVLAIAACNKPDGPVGPEIFEAKQIKVTFSGSGNAFALNDEIVVFNGVSGEDRNAAARYQCITMEGNVATFEFLADGDVTEIDETLSEIVALYPPQAATYDAASGKLSYTFIGTQSFVAKGSPKSKIEFKPTCGGIDLKLSGLSTINSMEITSSQAISGACEVDMTADAPVLAVTGSTTSVAFDLVPPVVLQEAGTAIPMVFPAGTYETISFNAKDANGGNMETIAENVIVKAGQTTTISDTYFVPTRVEDVVVTGLNKFLTSAGKTVSLEGVYTVLPEDATNRNVIFSSDNEAVATVSNTGVVTATGNGTAVITIASEDNAEKTASVTVKVTDLPVYPEVTRSTPVSIHNCDEMIYFNKTNGEKGPAVISTDNPKEGAGFFYNMSIKGQNQWMVVERKDGAGANKAVDGHILSTNRAHLTFWFYLPVYEFEHPTNAGQIVRNDAAKFISRLTPTGTDNKAKGRIELGSSLSNSANNGIYWHTTETLNTHVTQADGSLGALQDGWNFIDLAVKDARHNLGDWHIKPNGLNWFRFYIEGSANSFDNYYFGFDDIAIYEDYTQETTAEKQYLHDLSDLSGFGSAYYNVDEQAVGNSFGTGINVVSLKLDEPLVSKADQKHGHLHFKMYISDIDAFQNCSGQIELTSSGTCDKEEICWLVSKVAPCLHNGWNDVVLDFDRVDAWATDFNPANINWFRFYEDFKKPVTIMFKDFYVFNEKFADEQ